MVIEESILISADINEVWGTLTDLACWKDWNSGLTVAAGETGRLVSGKKFTFCIRPFVFPVRLRTVIEEIIPNERLVWRGWKFGIFSRHEFLLRQTGEGVSVTSRETLRGLPLLPGGPAFTKGTVRNLTIAMLNDLKKASEKAST
jgi:uncharacterized protein YndB with AHSA1/START domain